MSRFVKSGSPHFPVSDLTCLSDVMLMWQWLHLDFPFIASTAITGFSTIHQHAQSLLPAQVLREGLARYLPKANGRMLKAVACMFTNSPDTRFVIDLHPNHPQVHP